MQFRNRSRKKIKTKTEKAWPDIKDFRKVFLNLKLKLTSSQSRYILSRAMDLLLQLEYIFRKPAEIRDTNEFPVRFEVGGAKGDIRGASRVSGCYRLHDHRALTLTSAGDGCLVTLRDCIAFVERFWPFEVWVLGGIVEGSLKILEVFLEQIFVIPRC